LQRQTRGDGFSASRQATAGPDGSPAGLGDGWRAEFLPSGLGRPARPNLLQAARNGSRMRHWR